MDKEKESGGEGEEIIKALCKERGGLQSEWAVEQEWISWGNEREEM